MLAASPEVRRCTMRIRVNKKHMNNNDHLSKYLGYGESFGEALQP